MTNNLTEGDQLQYSANESLSMYYMGQRGGIKTYQIQGLEQRFQNP